MRLSVLLVCVFVAAVLSVGCGSGGSTGGSSGGTSAETTTAGTETNASGGEAGSAASQSGPLTKKAFVKEAEAICHKIPATYGEKSEALAKSMKNGQKPTTGETNLKAAVPADHLAIEELEALSPPTGDEQKVEAIIQALENGVKGVEEQPESELSGPKSPYAEWQKLTKDYGLSFCSQL
jgi:hypothetical protein